VATTATNVRKSTLETLLLAIMSAGLVGLVGGSVALVSFAFLLEGPRRLRLSGLAFRSIGLGLGSIWVGYGLLLIPHEPVMPGTLIAAFLIVAGTVAVWVALRRRRPLG
jgi:hypothetical protein